MLAGCSLDKLSSDNGYGDSQSFMAMEEEALLDYEVPVSTPHILVDEVGYLTGSSKVAFFYGNTLPETFDVIDASSGETVYTGSTELKGHSDEYDADIAYGDFSDYGTEGTYYIQAEYLGRSYEFSIGNDLYGDIFNEALKTYYYNRCGVTLTADTAGDNAHNACHTEQGVLRDDITLKKDVAGGWHQDSTGSKDIVTQGSVLGTMLLAYEFYPSAFKDDTGIPESNNDIPDILDEAKFEADWLLKMQDDETGAVYSGITVSEGGTNEVIYIESASSESSYAFAYAMSKFSYLYKDYDMEYATECLRAADRAYSYASLNDEDKDTVSELKFAASAELYRASGDAEYQKCAEEYLSSYDYSKEPTGFALFGMLTYINTKQKVSVDLCDGIMKTIMKEAENISSASRVGALLVPETEVKDDTSSLLDKMIIMTVTDYVITNREYDTIIENYLHYFLGRNFNSISYLDNAGTYSYKEINESLGLMKQFESDSKLIFMLSKIISGSTDKEE